MHIATDFRVTLGPHKLLDPLLSDLRLMGVVSEHPSPSSTSASLQHPLPQSLSSTIHGCGSLSPLIFYFFLFKKLDSRSLVAFVEIFMPFTITSKGGVPLVATMPP
ncbi:hypothetical protein Hanom_Chr16g01471121 [Helianthus anomalus]